MTSGDDRPPSPAGMPRWLVIGLAVKLALIVAITVAVLWWAWR